MKYINGDVNTFSLLERSINLERLTDKHLKIATSLITSNTHESDRARIIKALAEVPVKRLEAIGSMAASLFTPDMNAVNRALIIKALAEVPVERLEAIGSMATSLVTQDMYGLDRVRIIQALTAVLDSERERIYQQIQTLVDRTGVRFNKYQHAASLIQTLSEFNDNQRATAFVNGVIRLCERDKANAVDIDGNRFLTHMQTMKTRMSNMNQDEIGVLLGYGQSTHKKIVKSFIVSSLLSTALEPASSNAVSKEELMKFINGDVNTFSLLERSINLERLTDKHIKIATSLITSDMSAMIRAFIIKALAKVPVEKLEAIGSMATSLFTPAMYGFDRSRIIEALAKVPVEKLEDFKSTATSLFTSDMYKYDRVGIIAALAEVPVERLEAIGSMAASLITPDMYRWELASVIAALAAVLDSKRERIYQQIQTLVDRRGVRFNKYQHAASLIQTLSAFNDNQRAAAFVNEVIRLCERDNADEVVVDGNRLLTHMQRVQARMSKMNQDEVRMLLSHRC